MENTVPAKAVGEGSSTPDRAQQTWERTLDQVPTLFGRLVYLAGLRNQNSGGYRHHGLAQAFGAEESQRTIQLSHEAIFAEWLNLDLRAQHTALDQYFKGLGESRAVVLQTWGVLTPYRALPPAAAGGAERMLYETDLELILELFRAECDESPQV